MQLSQMHDLGGCRAIVSDVNQVHELVKSWEDSRTNAELTKTYDYIANPRKSGYRDVHLVYRYRSDNPKTEVYNGLRIELQLRSALQHAWATAVEVAGTFTGQALKSGHGSEDWLEFFRLMGAEIAQTEECPPVEGTPKDPHVLREALRDLASNLRVDDLLSGWMTSMQAIRQVATKDAHYYVLSLDTAARTLNMAAFPKASGIAAEAERSRLEKESETHPGLDVVLVSADKIEELSKAFPNYNLDTTAFIAELRAAISD